MTKLFSNELFNKQAELDEYIGKSKNINMEDYKQERIIALQVEFNELINEIPFLFKYWSNKKMDRDKALEEYVDGKHFLLSIGNDLGINDYKYTKPVAHDMKRIVFGISNMISRLILTDKVYPQLVDCYILLGEKLGFSEDEIIDAYDKKYQTNIERQQIGY